MSLKEGIHTIPEKDYHEDPCPEPSLSRSILKNLLFDTPKRAWLNHPRLNPDHEEDDGGGKFDIGSAAHDLYLRGVDSVAVIEYDSYRKEAAKTERDDARANGLIPLLREQYDKVLDMNTVALEAIVQCDDLGITNLREDGESELTFIWQEGGRWMRVRTDWISNDRKIIVDYKTSGLSVNPDTIGKQIANMQYDIQLAFYRRGVKAVTGIDPTFIFMFQEVEPPHFCSFIGLMPEFIEMGKQKTEYGIYLWDKHMKSNEWPNYPKQIAYVDAPPWELTKWEAISIDIGEGE